MKKRLQRIYHWEILLTLGMALAAILLAVFLKAEDTRVNLWETLETAVQWTKDSNDDLQSMAENIAALSPPIRVTFLMDSGLVLADSSPEADYQENHVSDPELRGAKRGEVGRSFRYSPSGGTVVLYLAKYVSPSLILRVSYPVLAVVRTFLWYGSLVGLLFLLLYLVQRRMLSGFTKDLEESFAQVRSLLDGEEERGAAVFPEFQPSLDAIAYKMERLQEDREEILRTLNLREDFVAHASHELRSPLTSVRGFAEMLREGMAESEEERQLCLDTITGECDRMLGVIENILRLRRAGEEEEEEKEPVEVHALAEEICRALLPQAQKKEISLLVEGELILLAPEKDLWEILYNLVSNAVSYGREGGHVWIRLKAEEISVSDDGRGIRQEHLSRIFEPFFRVEDGRGTGTGLGLSIVKALTERMGGRISVESAFGEGTSFRLVFGGEDA